MYSRWSNESSISPYIPSAFPYLLIHSPNHSIPNHKQYHKSKEPFHSHTHTNRGPHPHANTNHLPSIQIKTQSQSIHSSHHIEGCASHPQLIPSPSLFLGKTPEPRPDVGVEHARPTSEASNRNSLPVFVLMERRYVAGWGLALSEVYSGGWWISYLCRGSAWELRICGNVLEGICGFGDYS